MTPASAFRALLDESIGDEAWVKRALPLLEADLREVALLGLADWQGSGITSAEIFESMTALARPSWGSWNGLLASLRRARRAALREASAETRSKIDAAGVLHVALETLERRVAPELAAAVIPLAEALGMRSSRARLNDLLVMPIALRNRVAHDSPSDPVWWGQVARGLRALVHFLADDDPWEALSDKPRHEPWFIPAPDGGPWAFNGLTREMVPIYVRLGATRHVAEATAGVLQAVQLLLGKTDVQEQDFRRLLGHLAPEEVRGVMMGDFLVGGPVGQGGFATVHQGRQLSTGRRVAIKILRDGLSEEARLRFQQEASYLSRFSHPSIVSVIAYGEETWRAPRSFDLASEPWYAEFSRSAPLKVFMALEWIEGQTLEAVYQDRRSGKGSPPDRAVAHWLALSAEALSIVHSAGLVHRDIKPSNLMLTTRGEVKVMDFGVARSQDESRTLMTTAGTAMGTPAYMSPEQVAAVDADAEVGPPTDVYSLCATFYELFTGARLFAHDVETPERVRTRKAGRERPVAPGRARPGLPWEIDAILSGGLEPEAADRYRSASDLARDVRHYLADEPIEYRRPSLRRRTVLWYRRNRTLARLAATASLVLSAYTWVNIEARRTAERATANAERLRAEATVRTAQALLQEGGVENGPRSENFEAAAIVAEAVALLANAMSSPPSASKAAATRLFSYWMPALRALDLRGEASGMWNDIPKFACWGRRAYSWGGGKMTLLDFPGCTAQGWLDQTGDHFLDVNRRRIAVYELPRFHSLVALTATGKPRRDATGSFPDGLAVHDVALREVSRTGPHGFLLKGFVREDTNSRTTARLLLDMPAFRPSLDLDFDYSEFDLDTGEPPQPGTQVVPVYFPRLQPESGFWGSRAVGGPPRVAVKEVPCPRPEEAWEHLYSCWERRNQRRSVQAELGAHSLLFTFEGPSVDRRHQGGDAGHLPNRGGSLPPGEEPLILGVRGEYQKEILEACLVGDGRFFYVRTRFDDFRANEGLQVADLEQMKPVTFDPPPLHDGPACSEIITDRDHTVLWAGGEMFGYDEKTATLAAMPRFDALGGVLALGVQGRERLFVLSKTAASDLSLSAHDWATGAQQWSIGLRQWTRTQTPPVWPKLGWIRVDPEQFLLLPGERETVAVVQGRVVQFFDSTAGVPLTGMLDVLGIVEKPHPDATFGPLRVEADGGFSLPYGDRLLVRRPPLSAHEVTASLQDVPCATGFDTQTGKRLENLPTLVDGPRRCSASTSEARPELP